MHFTEPVNESCYMPSPASKKSDSIFSCPKCQSIQPFKSAWMLTRYTKLTCSDCSEAIRPIASSVPRIHAISGLGAAFVGIFLKQHLSLLQTILMIVPVVLIFNCLVVTKTVQFEQDSEGQPEND
jgi:hypothetical protein